MSWAAMQLRHADWALSHSAFDRDWPPAELCADGLYHFGPAGQLLGFGVAKSRAAAERARAGIRYAAVDLARFLIWC